MPNSSSATGSADHDLAVHEVQENAPDPATCGRMPVDQREFFYVDEAAAMLKVSERYLKEEYIRKGVIPAASPGTEWLIPKRTLFDALERMALAEAEARVARYSPRPQPVVVTWEPAAQKKKPGRPRLPMPPMTI